MSNIFIFDQSDLKDKTAEDLAMLSALYSRTYASVLDNLKKLEKSDSGKFMERYYINYGHDSIGELGNFYTFFENISILAAFIIEDYPLFKGQETSTRYNNSGNQTYHQTRNQTIDDLSKLWIDFYNRNLNKQFEYLKELHPNWSDKEIWVLTYDIMRGFLPISSHTNVALNSDLNNYKKVLMSLQTYGEYFPEMQELFKNYSELFNVKYSHSIPKNRTFDKYIVKSKIKNYSNVKKFKKIKLSKMDYKYLKERTTFSPIPATFDNYGSFYFDGTLDFGSYRDLHRHRTVTLTFKDLKKDIMNPTFNEYYIYNLDNKIKSDYQSVFDEFIDKSKNIKDLNKLYCYPMMFNINFNIVSYLRYYIYLVELRSLPTVHPTLRGFIYILNKQLEDNGIQIKHSLEDYFDATKRAKHDISEKSET